jgi:acylphosphatase
MPTRSETKCIAVRVQGRVQGVGFRQWVRKLARQRDLSGWVMNQPDGRTVEGAFEGPEDRLERMIELMSSGPPGSQVDEIEVKWIDPQNLQGPFEIRRS